MTSLVRPLVLYDAAKLAGDMAARGWINKDLARAAGVSEMAVSRFLRGERQTARTLAKLAKALGYSPRRYLIRPDQGAAA
jgi:transcriptional regulator with XRE-family HTH domain